MSAKHESDLDSAVLVLFLQRGWDGLARVRNFLTNQGLDMTFWEQNMLSYFSSSEASEEQKGLCRGETARIYILVDRRYDAIVKWKTVPRHEQIALSSRVTHTDELAAMLRRIGLKNPKSSYGLQALLLCYFVAFLEEDLDLVKLLNGYVGAKKPDYDFIRQHKKAEAARVTRESEFQPILWSPLGLEAEA